MPVSWTREIEKMTLASALAKQIALNLGSAAGPTKADARAAWKVERLAAQVAAKLEKVLG